MTKKYSHMRVQKNQWLIARVWVDACGNYDEGASWVSDYGKLSEKKKEFKQASISKDDKKNKKARDEKYMGW